MTRTQPPKSDRAVVVESIEREPDGSAALIQLLNRNEQVGRKVNNVEGPNDPTLIEPVAVQAGSKGARSYQH
jgi:hypothetical protein